MITLGSRVPRWFVNRPVHEPNCVLCNLHNVAHAVNILQHMLTAHAVNILVQQNATVVFKDLAVLQYVWENLNNFGTRTGRKTAYKMIKLFITIYHDVFLFLLYSPHQTERENQSPGSLNSADLGMLEGTAMPHVKESQNRGKYADINRRMTYAAIEVGLVTGAWRNCWHVQHTVYAPAP